MMLSTIFVTVKSRSAGRKFLMPPIRDSKLDDRPLGTPLSFKRSVRRLDMEENRPKRSVDPCWFAVALLIVVNCVIFVVARTL
jgi:hypothetical protein